MLPLDDAVLALRSDRQYSDGTYSVYADGVCNVTAKIFATTQYYISGDATLDMNGSGSGKRTTCLRRVTLIYPDGISETIPVFSNLREVENTTYSIPVGATVKRQLHIGSGSSADPSRCDALPFGYGEVSGLGVGSDSVLVTRINASTWHVVSQPSPHNFAYCKSNQQLYAMPVDFVVVSSSPLP